MYDKYTILIADDDTEILRLVRLKLESEYPGVYRLIETSNGTDALDQVALKKPDLVILDINMPNMNGLEVCRSLRTAANTKNIPIIILSARRDDVDRVIGLEFGADDYITKPFNPKELILRIQNVLKRVNYKEGQEDFQVHGSISLDKNTYEVKVNDAPVNLTLTEFKLLSCLMENPGKVQSRDILLEHVWDQGDGVYSRTVDTHIQRLRSKLQDAGDSIETVRGVGYRIRPLK